MQSSCGLCRGGVQGACPVGRVLVTRALGPWALGAAASPAAPEAHEKGSKDILKRWLCLSHKAEALTGKEKGRSVRPGGDGRPLPRVAL